MTTMMERGAHAELGDGGEEHETPPGTSAAGAHAAGEAALRADLQQARRLARRLLRLQQRHPLFIRRQRRANYLLALEWLLLIACTYPLVYGPPPGAANALLLIPWSIHSSLAFG